MLRCAPKLGLLGGGRGTQLICTTEQFSCSLDGREAGRMKGIISGVHAAPATGALLAGLPGPTRHRDVRRSPPGCLLPQLERRAAGASAIGELDVMIA
jgi:hypothetical protein